VRRKLAAAATDIEQRLWQAALRERIKKTVDARRKLNGPTAPFLVVDGRECGRILFCVQFSLYAI